MYVVVNQLNYGYIKISQHNQFNSAPHHNKNKQAADFQRLLYYKYLLVYQMGVPLVGSNPPKWL